MSTEGKPRPGYADIASGYRAKINAGELSPGDAMPTVNEVAEAHGVARNTAVRAYDALKKEGLIITRAGAGTVVASPPAYLSGGDRLARMETGGEGLLPGESTVERIAGMRSVDDVTVAEALGVELRDEIGVRIRVFVREGQRTMYAISAYHLRAVSAVPELVDPAPFPGQWQKIYEERTGRKVYRSPERYGARIASPEELRKLHVFNDPSAARAVLVATTVFHDETGPLAYWEDVYAPGLTRVDPSAE